MTIKIVLPLGAGPKVANGTKVYTESGQEINGITRMVIDIRPGEVIQAQITIPVSLIENSDHIRSLVIQDDG